MLLNAAIVLAERTATPAPATGGFDITNLFFPLLIVFMIYLMWNNGRKRKRAEQELRTSLAVGVNVILHSGITGTIVSMDDVSAVIESTPKTKIRVVLAAIRGIDTSLDAPAADATDADKDTK